MQVYGSVSSTRAVSIGSSLYYGDFLDILVWNTTLRYALFSLCECCRFHRIAEFVFMSTLVFLPRSAADVANLQNYWVNKFYCTFLCCRFP